MPQKDTVSKRGTESSIIAKGTSSATPEKQRPRLLRTASNILQSITQSPRYKTVTQSLRKGGTNFGGHIRRVKQFSRQNIVYNWIEPTAWALSGIGAVLLYHYDIITSILLLIPLALLFSEFLMVVFSLISILFQHIKSYRNHRLRLMKIEHKGGECTPEEQEKQLDARAAFTEARSQRCRRFPRPPQVVRWDILGVTLSSWFGKINSIPLPVLIREPFYKMYSAYFKVNLDEIKEPLHSFRNLQEFFTRELRPGVRPVDTAAPLVSPVDAKLVVCGRVEGDRVEQVKGVTYPLSSFLGEDTWETIKGRNLYHCVLYLAPGDYHRIHSATHWAIRALRHFPGTLFPISPIVARLVPNLFALNERVVLTGQWKRGFFSSTAVGAYHVGSMAFNFDSSIRTNTVRRDYQNPNLAFLSSRDMGAYAYDFQYEDEQLVFQHGEELGTFKLGSTIVLVFEVPQDEAFVFDVEPGTKVQMGQSLGKIVSATPSSST